MSVKYQINEAKYAKLDEDEDVADALEQSIQSLDLPCSQIPEKLLDGVSRTKYNYVENIAGMEYLVCVDSVKTLAKEIVRSGIDKTRTKLEKHCGEMLNEKLHKLCSPYYKYVDLSELSVCGFTPAQCTQIFDMCERCNFFYPNAMCSLMEADLPSMSTTDLAIVCLFHIEKVYTPNVCESLSEEVMLTGFHATLDRHLEKDDLPNLSFEKIQQVTLKYILMKRSPMMIRNRYPKCCGFDWREVDYFCDDYVLQKCNLDETLRDLNSTGWDPKLEKTELATVIRIGRATLLGANFIN